MKKIMILMVIMVMAFSAPGFSVSPTIDTFIHSRMDSDLRPMEDAGRILDVTKRGVDHTVDTVKKPFGFLLDPIYKVRDVSFDIVNRVYDGVTLRHLRERG
jgi:hypothetical protein